MTESLSLKTEKLHAIEGITIRTEDNRRAELRGTLPASIRSEECLIFQTKGNAAEVFIDDRLIYSYGTNVYFCGGDSCGNEMLPSVYCIVPIPEDSRGAAFTIKFTSTYPKMNIPELLLGSKSEAYYNLIRENFFTVIFSVLSVVLGIVLIVFQVHSRFSQKIKIKDKYVLYWGIFCILSGIWVLTDSPVLQMASGRAMLFFLLSFYAFMLLPIPFLFFIKNFCGFDGTAGKIYDVSALVFAVNFILQNILYLAAAAELRRMLVVTHSLIAIGFLLIFATLIPKYIRAKTPTGKYILIAMTIFVAFGILQFVQFYFIGQEHNNSLYLRIGMLLFTFTLAVFVLRQNSVLFEEATKIEVYKKLAMYDALTQCENRAAMDFYVKEAYPEGGQPHTIGFAVIDLNNLKETNDTFGHVEGDALIQDTAECLRMSFDERVKFYRTGGDEFYIIFSDIGSMEHQIRKLYEIAGEYNACHARKISFAMGTCVGDIRDYRDIRHMLKLADDAMYVQKGQMHKAPEPLECNI